MTIIAILICLLFPAFALWAEKRSSLVRKIGAVTLCYALGIALATLGLRPEGEALGTVYGLAALLAVPLVLFAADIKAWLHLAPAALKAFLGAVIAACIGASVAFGLAEKLGIVAYGDALAGMAVGVYTGGTPNLNAIALAMQVPENLITQANLADAMFFLPYFFFMMTIGPSLLRRFLPKLKEDRVDFDVEKDALEDEDFVQKVKGYAMSLVTALLCFGLAYGVTLLIAGGEDVALLVSLITLGGLAFSRISVVREMPYSFKAGEYALLVFCVGIGLSIDIQTLAVGMLPVIAFMFVAAGSAFLIHLLFSKLLNVDTDTFVITSVAAICSPLFVPLVARKLGNRAIITSGMTTGVMGFAVGNWLGLAIAHMLI